MSAVTGNSFITFLLSGLILLLTCPWVMLGTRVLLLSASWKVPDTHSEGTRPRSHGRSAKQTQLCFLTET